MTGCKSISVLALSAAMVLPAAAAPGRAVITTAQIAAAISAAGMDVSAQQVTLLAEVVAATGTPALRVQSMERWGEHRMRVRMECASNQECLPFLVAVQLSDENAAQSALVKAGARSTAVNGPGPFVVRVGSPAILLLDGDHVHVQLSVVCLENGATGQTIRVASNDRRQTYTAQVIDAAVLRARL